MAIWPTKLDLCVKKADWDKPKACEFDLIYKVRFVGCSWDLRFRQRSKACLGIAIGRRFLRSWVT